MADAVLNDVDPLADARAAQIAALRTACTNSIEAGFPSDALGSRHTYPFTPTDQNNLAFSLVTTLLDGSSRDTWTTPLWCVDAREGQWMQRPHNLAQAKRAFGDAMRAKSLKTARYAALLEQINAASTVADIQAVVWLSA